MKFRLFIITTVCFLAGSIIGWRTYRNLVENAYDDLRTEINSANIFESLFADDPAFLHIIYEFQRQPGNQEVINRYNTIRENQDLLVWRMLRTQGIIRGDDGLNKGSILLRSSLETVFNNELQTLLGLSGVNLIKKIFEESGRQFNRNAKVDEQQIENLIVNFLSNQPYAFEQYLDNLLQISDTRESNFGKPRDMFPGDWGKDAVMNDLVSLLYSNFGVSSSFDELDKKMSLAIGGSNFVAQDNIEEYRQMTQFVSKLIIAVNNHPDVSEARNWLSVVEGPMQCLMIMVFFICILLLVVLLPSNRFKGLHAKSDNLVEKLSLRSGEEYGIKRTFRWGTSTLPIFGFIGTILGLMAALGDAYKIPLAPDETSSAIAISDITNTLSIAFTTTLMAFVLNVVLSLIALLFLKKDVEDELQVIHQDID
jgi:hypothetical protein